MADDLAVSSIFPVSSSYPLCSYPLCSYPLCPEPVCLGQRPLGRPGHHAKLAVDANPCLPVLCTSDRWSVSSAKPGNGVDLLVDGRSDSFWQSDGLQPHCITLEFHQPVELSRVAIACDFRVDESYTPQKITIRVGTRWSDIHTLRTEEVSEPQGWIVIPLAAVRARVLQILILANHQNGRDTHVRQVKVFGPRKDVTSTLASRPGRVGFREVKGWRRG